MAEGDRYVIEETGEEYVEGPGGRFVRAIGQFPEKLSQVGPAIAAGATSAAKDNLMLGSGITKGFGHLFDAVGLDQAAEGMRTATANIEQARADVTSDFEIAQQQENPVPFFAGQMIGSGLPGNARLQAAYGIAQGAGFGQTPTEQLVLGGLGAAGGFLGARSGTRTQQNISTRIQQAGSASMASRANAARVLAREGVPMTESDLAVPGVGGQAARQRDLVRDTLDPGAQDVAKREALTEVTTDTILPGNRQNIIDNEWLTKADEAVSQNYNSLRAQVGALDINDPMTDRALVNMMESIESVPPSVRDNAQFYVDQIMEDVASGSTSGQWWSDLRSTLNNKARNADDFQERQLLFSIREELDLMVSRGDPEFIAQLNEANELFRLVEPLHRPGVLQQASGTINPISYIRNMKDMFPGIYRTTFEQSARGKKLFDLFSAASRFPAFRSSGTAERLTAASFVRGAQARGRLALGSIPEAIGGGAGRRAAVETRQTEETSEEEEE